MEPLTLPPPEIFQRRRKSSSSNSHPKNELVHTDQKGAFKPEANSYDHFFLLLTEPSLNDSEKDQTNEVAVN
jgi:hypothetical protein